MGKLQGLGSTNIGIADIQRPPTLDVQALRESPIDAQTPDRSSDAELGSMWCPAPPAGSEHHVQQEQGLAARKSRTPRRRAASDWDRDATCSSWHHANGNRSSTSWYKAESSTNNMAELSKENAKNNQENSYQYGGSSGCTSWPP